MVSELNRIGFIGLGVMGRPMAKNLIRAGYGLVVYDINPDPVDELVKLGAERARNCADVARKANIIITMLPDSPEVKEAVMGEEGVLDGAAPGSTLIDMSSISPTVSQEIGRVAAERGVRMLDAPVSGGEPKAISGALSIMVGGSEEVFETCRQLLSAMGSSVVRVGALGSGNVAKLANQIVVALNIAAVSEAFVLAVKAGVDPETVYRAIRGGLAGSTVMDAKVPMMLERNFEPGFRIDLHVKDLANAVSAAHAYGVPVPLTSAVMEMMQASKVDGLGSKDHGALVRFYERLAHAEVARQ